MEKQVNGYLLSQLEQKRNINIALLSHNAYWTQVEKLKRSFNNVDVKVFGSGTAYLRMAKNNKQRQIDDSDLIIFYSSDYYDADEIDYLKMVASNISKEKNKRVSIGYLYFIKEEEKTSQQIYIVSFKDGEEEQGIIYPESHCDAYNLAEITLLEHDNFELERKVSLQKVKNNI